MLRLFFKLSLLLPVVIATVVIEEEGPIVEVGVSHKRDRSLEHAYTASEVHSRNHWKRFFRSDLSLFCNMPAWATAGDADFIRIGGETALRLTKSPNCTGSAWNQISRVALPENFRIEVEFQVTGDCQVSSDSGGLGILITDRLSADPANMNSCLNTIRGIGVWVDDEQIGVRYSFDPVALPNPKAEIATCNRRPNAESGCKQFVVIEVIHDRLTVWSSVRKHRSRAKLCSWRAKVPGLRALIASDFLTIGLAGRSPAANWCTNFVDILDYKVYEMKHHRVEVVREVQVEPAVVLPGLGGIIAPAVAPAVVEVDRFRERHHSRSDSHYDRDFYDPDSADEFRTIRGGLFSDEIVFERHHHDRHHDRHRDRSDRSRRHHRSREVRERTELWFDKK